jgi:type III pantothenate kinase
MMEHPRTELVLDVGNTRIKLGLFRKGRLTDQWSIAQDDLTALTPLLDGDPPDRIAFGSVGSPGPELMTRLEAAAPVIPITGASPSPVRTCYADPGSLGVDRLANVVGAATLFPRRAVLAVDLGTCVTYDLVDELAVHRGGAISPGMHMRARAMHAYSARLPEVDPPEDGTFPGTDTAGSLAAGIQHGLLMELRGFIAEFRQQHPGLAVVLTGGDALRFARVMKSGIFAHPSLTLLGLHALLHYVPDSGIGRPR